MITTAHAQETKELFAALNGDAEKGLSKVQVQERLSKFGKNVVSQSKPQSLFILFLSQFQSPFIYLLLIASVVTFALREFIDTAVILFVVILNACIGLFQENRAKKTMEALRKILAPKAYVVREGKTIIIPAANVVVGDIILLQAGDRVPADARIFEGFDLRTNEASLTGESLPVDKSNAVLNADTMLADRVNMVWASTLVLTGTCKAIVVAIGKETEVGKIAQEVNYVVEDKTPLEKKLDAFSKVLALIIGFISLIIFIIGLIRDQDPITMFKVVVGIAVSAIPEGLPVVVTVVLSVGMWRMAKKAAVIRSLPSVETLGSTTIVCTDKTGTLTKGQMNVEQIIYDDTVLEVDFSDKDKVAFLKDGKPISESEQADMDYLLRFASLSTTLRVGKKVENADTVFGDPTETALVDLAHSIGIDRNNLHHQYPKLGELPFDQTTRYSVVFRKGEKGTIAFVKGAPETVLGLVSSMRFQGKVQGISQDEQKVLLERFEKMAKQGLRIIAVAVDEEPFVGAHDKPTRYLPKKLTLLGIFGIGDPLRPETIGAIEKTRAAGMKVLMITGDHKATAESIGRKIGLVTNVDQVIEAKDLRLLSQKDLGERLRDVTVIARAVPLDKLHIVDALKARGEIVAMTGDGVNDAPSLKTANIGIAMGKTGTQVAIEASDMVLTDDNFASIVAAVEGGRWIVGNLRKVIFFLISTSLGEVAIIFISLLVGWPLPLVATQIIWLNLVTDSFCNTPLALEPKESNVMKQPPQDPKTPLFTIFDAKRMIFLATIMLIGSLFVFMTALPHGVDYARSLALYVMAAFQWFNAFNSRSQTQSLFSLGFASNKYLLWGIAVAVLLQGVVTYVPFFNPIFHTVPLSLYDVITATAIASSILWLEELRKVIVNGVGKRAQMRHEIQAKLV